MCTQIHQSRLKDGCQRITCGPWSLVAALVKEKGTLSLRVARRDCYRVDKLDEWEWRVI